MDNKLTQFVFDKLGVSTFRKFLDLSSLRHKLISSNVANASTPGFERRDIDFQKEFAKATSSGSGLTGAVTHAGHIPLGQHQARAPEIQQDKVASGDLNSVQIDREVSELAQNELLFTVGAKLLQQKFTGLRTVITSE